MSLQIAHYFEFGDFRFDPKKMSLRRHGEIVHLTPKALEILRLLIENQGTTVSRDKLLETVWKDTFIEEGNINFNISLLRKALNQNGAEKTQFIKTVPKEGYRFIADVQEIIAENGADAGVETEVVKEGSLKSAFLRFKESENLKRNRVRWHFIGIVLLGVLLVTSFGLWWKLTDKNLSNVPVAARNIQSVAVLPLKDLSDDEQNQTLSLGLTDNLISRLGGLNRFAVRPLSAVEKFGATEQDALKFGEALRVDAVLEGSIQTVDNRLRINVRLIDVRDGAQIWANSFDETEGDFFKLQDAIAGQIARSLALNLTESEKIQFYKRYTENQEAYQAYLRGRFFFDKRTAENLEKAIAEFEHALQLDPNYAPAFSGLADAYSMQINFDEPRHLIQRRTRLNVQKALELDETLAEAQTTLGSVYRAYDWDWENSEKHYKRAIELNPNYVNARQWYALLLITLGRGDEAFAEIEKAREIDPLSKTVLVNKRVIQIYRRQTADLISLTQQISLLENNKYEALRDLAIAYERTGDYAKAIETAEELKKINHNKIGSTSLSASLAIAYKHTGNFAKAREMIAYLEQLPKADTGAVYQLAAVHSELGNTEKALELLQKSFENHDDRMLWVKVEPRFDKIRSEPRFQKILQKMNL